MNKIYLFTFLLLLKTFTAGAQKLDWAKSIGTAGSDEGSTITYDNAGNTYIAGNFWNSMDADPGPGVYMLNAPGLAPFILKLDAGGNFKWAVTFSGAWSLIAGNFYPYIAIDKTGAVYTVGAFTGTTDFDPGAGTYDLTAPTSVSNIYLCKLDASGNFKWAKQIGNTTESSSSNALAVDSSGDLVFTGRFKGVVDFDPGVGTSNLNAPVGGMYVCKFDTAGNYIWANQLAGISASSSGTPYGLAIDKSDQIYIGGAFGGSVDFDPGPGVFNLNSAGTTDIFVGKYDAIGTMLWAKQIGGAHADICNSISLDKSDNVYCTGYFNDTVDFDPSGSSVYNLIAASGGSDYLLKLDAKGNFKWAKNYSFYSSSSHALVATDTAGGVYLNGTFNKTADFDFGTGIVNMTPKGTLPDAYLCKYDSSGVFIWAKQLTTPLSKAIAVDLIGSIYIAGQFSNSCDFDPGPDSLVLTSLGVQDAFILKLKQCIISIDQTITTTGSVLTSNEKLGMSYQWIDCATKMPIAGAINRSYAPVKSGSYAVVIQRDNCLDTSGCVNFTGTAIDNISLNEHMYCYPNPTNGEMNIHLGRIYSTTNIDVTNILGQSVYRHSFVSKEDINFSIESAPGIYFIEIRTDDGNTTKIKMQKR